MTSSSSNKLRLLVVGGGGREHALVWKLAQSPVVAKIFCAPGNPGIAQFATCVDISSSNIAALRHFAQEARIDLTVVGPEIPLVAGLVDEFEAHGLFVFGPSQKAAMLEGSKAFAKDFMRKYRIPTAEYHVFTEAEAARKHVQSCKIPVVIKADGLAAGKGAVVAHSRNEALNALALMMEQKQFGEAGSRVVIEEFMEGEEVSVFCLTDGVSMCLLPSAQDHKAIYNGDLGPNTGGMGAYSPAPMMNEELLQRVHRQILQPVIEGMAMEHKPYRGVLYAGLMLTAEGPKVVEFNCRFGDPEAEVILPLITSDLAEAMWLVAQGDLGDYKLTLSPQWALTVVLASGGYPGAYETGKVINGVPRGEDKHVLAFHAGTQEGPRGKLVTSGGRVLAITGLGDTFQQARERAYLAVNRVRFEGEYHRTDIGAKALKHLKRITN